MSNFIYFSRFDVFKKYESLSRLDNDKKRIFSKRISKLEDAWLWLQLKDIILPIYYSR